MEEDIYQIRWRVGDFIASNMTTNRHSLNMDLFNLDKKIQLRLYLLLKVE